MRRRSHPFLALLGLFLAVGLLIRIVEVLWPLIVLVVVITIASKVARSRRRSRREALERCRAAQAELCARADYEHQLVLRGDPRGTYGRFPPAV